MPSPSPSPGENEGGEGQDGQATPSPTAAGSPPKKPTGDVKGAGEEQAQANAETGAEAEPMQDENKLSEEQAERLLRAMRDEEQRVQLDERRAARRVYNDW